jgi:hypothetical protein
MQRQKDIAKSTICALNVSVCEKLPCAALGMFNRVRERFLFLKAFFLPGAARYILSSAIAAARASSDTSVPFAITTMPEGVT